MPSSHRRARTAVALLAAALGLAAVPSSASATQLVVGEDPAGDAADPHPGRDLVGVALTYDRRTGHLRAGVRLAGTPSDDAPANLTVFAGHRTATGCNRFPAIGFATQTDLRTAQWVRLDGADAAPTTGWADKRYEDAAEEYEVTDRALAGERPDCVVAQLNEPGNTAVVYDVAGPFDLRGLPELEAKLGRLPATMAPGRTRTVRLTLRNPGDASTGRVRLSASRARGMTVRMPRSVPALRAGAKRTVPIRVTLSRRARSTTPLRVTATAASGLRARDEGSLSLRRAAPGGGGGGGGGDSGSGSGLCYRYTWYPPFSELVPC